MMAPTRSAARSMSRGARATGKKAARATNVMPHDILNGDDARDDNHEPPRKRARGLEIKEDDDTLARAILAEKPHMGSDDERIAAWARVLQLLRKDGYKGKLTARGVKLEFGRALTRHSKPRPGNDRKNKRRAELFAYCKDATTSTKKMMQFVRVSQNPPESVENEADRVAATGPSGEDLEKLKLVLDAVNAIARDRHEDSKQLLSIALGLAGARTENTPG